MESVTDGGRAFCRLALPVLGIGCSCWTGPHHRCTEQNCSHGSGPNFRMSFICSHDPSDKSQRPNLRNKSCFFRPESQRERERETGQRRVGLREKDDKNVVCFQNENADKLKHPVLSNTTYLLQGDGCTKLHSLLSKACPILIDFAAEYCWRVIIHLGMICVSILLNPTVVYMFPTLTHESPAQRSSCWRRRITRLQISYIRAGWRERDAGEQRRTVLAVQKAFGNKIKVVALKGKTRTNDIKVGRWGCGWVRFLFTRTFELCLMVRREWVDFNSIDCRFRHQQTHRYALANAAGCLEYRVDPERTVH